MKSIPAKVVPDLAHKFPEHLSHFLTANLRSDRTCTDLSCSVQRILSNYNVNAIMAVESFQFRGEVPIYNPHVHLVLKANRDTAESIAQQVKEKNQGTDVHLVAVYDTEGLLKYVTKDPTSLHYFRAEVDLSIPF